MSFQEFPWINLKFLSWKKKRKCIVDDVQNVYAAQVFDAFTVKVSFTSQEISKIEQTQSQHQASYLQLIVPTRVKTIAFSKAKSTSWHAGSLVITDGQKDDLSLRSPGPLMLIYFYIIMINFLLRFVQVILARTSLTLLNGVYKAELWSARRTLGRGSATFFLKRCVFLCIQLTN